MERAFRGIWMPSEIWLDERLTALDKTILMEIDSLDNEGGGCTASNEYLAQFCVCSTTKVSKSISKLVKIGLLEQIGFNGRNRVLHSRLAKSARQTCKKCKADLQKVQGRLAKSARR